MLQSWFFFFPFFLNFPLFFPPSPAHALSRLSESLGISNVFVATDNPEAVRLLRQLLPDMHIFANPNVDRQFMSEGVQVLDRTVKETLNGALMEP